MEPGEAGGADAGKGAAGSVSRRKEPVSGTERGPRGKVPGWSFL